MYRQIFTPTKHDNAIPVAIPPEWYGKKVEIIIFPVDFVSPEQKVESKEDKLMKLCGAWQSDMSAEEIVTEIQNSRTSGETHRLIEL